MPQKSFYLLCHITRVCDLFSPSRKHPPGWGPGVGEPGVLLGRTRSRGGLSAVSGSPCPALGGKRPVAEAMTALSVGSRSLGFPGANSWPGSLLVA